MKKVTFDWMLQKRHQTRKSMALALKKLNPRFLMKGIGNS